MVQAAEAALVEKEKEKDREWKKRRDRLMLGGNEVGK